MQTHSLKRNIPNAQSNSGCVVGDPLRQVRPKLGAPLTFQAFGVL